MQKLGEISTKIHEKQGPIVGGILAALTYQFVLQPEDKERRDVRYQKKLIEKQRKAELKQQKQSLRPRRRVSE